jgi:hypothetical protein
VRSQVTHDPAPLLSLFTKCYKYVYKYHKSPAAKLDTSKLACIIRCLIIVGCTCRFYNLDDTSDFDEELEDEEDMLSQPNSITTKKRVTSLDNGTLPELPKELPAHGTQRVIYDMLRVYVSEQSPLYTGGEYNCDIFLTVLVYNQRL